MDKRISGRFPSGHGTVSVVSLYPKDVTFSKTGSRLVSMQKPGSKKKSPLQQYIAAAFYQTMVAVCNLTCYFLRLQGICQTGKQY
ncbi:MAG: hypothetical protein LBF62_11025 [Tannerellaceae bacterium]|jgi:hypothetical protein|nr:hypothetical protein [Tannerellaceae bacterium]